MRGIKIKQKEVPEFRKKLWEKNRGICPLCREGLTPEDSALDHDHKTGHIRDTIHKDCNILLGKIENYMHRYGKRFRDKKTLEKFLSNVAEYIFKDYTKNPYHYLHKTPSDKLISGYRRALKRAKKPETKKKYRDLIKEAQRRTK